jgi:hypothetical protein
MPKKPWNRREIYSLVWEAPLVDVARLYGSSRTELKRVCHKLKIPLPQQGYWTKKRFGKYVRPAPPLQNARNLPFIPRLKNLPAIKATLTWQAEPVFPPDAELSAIQRVESTPRLGPEPKRRNELVNLTESALRLAEWNLRDCVLQKPFARKCLDIRVSEFTLKRALEIMNAIMLRLRQEGFVVRLSPDNQRTIVCIFGQEVPFRLTERLRVRARQEVKSLNKQDFHFEPTGILEFRAGERYCNSFRLHDMKDARLENLIHLCVGGLMRQARGLRLMAEQNAKAAARFEKKSKELAKLAEAIAEEESSVKKFQATVSDWRRAQELRNFVRALENGSPSRTTRHQRLNG